MARFYLSFAVTGFLATQYTLKTNSKSEFARRLFCALFYRQKYADVAHREISPDGLYLGYCSFGDMRDMPQVRAFHDKTQFGVGYSLHLKTNFKRGFSTLGIINSEGLY